MDNIKYLEKYLSKDKLNNGLEQLKMGTPVQYIVGNVDFYGNFIKVNKNVLIPRFETEQLVNIVYNYFKNKKNISIVDLGTGSGCIAISLKKMLNCSVDAVDICDKALTLAKENSELNNTKINFYLGDMLNPLVKKYDCIVSNPPYIAFDEDIMDLVKNNEPSIALYASNQGLFYYEEIIKNCKKYLNKNGILAFEIGYKQASLITELVNKYLPNATVVIKSDFSEKERFIIVGNIT